MQQSRKNKIIETSVLFQGLSNSGLGGILGRCRETEYSSNEYLFKAGQPVSQVYLVLEGVIQLYRGSDNGKHAVLGIRERSDVLGVTSALSDSAHYSTAKSVGRSKALAIPLDVFGELVSLDPALPQRLLRHVAGNLHDISEHMERLQLLQTTERLANYLWKIAPDKGGTTEIVLPCEKGLIATYLGMERESFSRALKKLRTVGVNTKGRRIQIEDPDALKRFSATAA